MGSLVLLQDHLAQSPHSAGGKMGLSGARAKIRPVLSLSYGEATDKSQVQSRRQGMKSKSVQVQDKRHQVEQPSASMWSQAKVGHHQQQTGDSQSMDIY